ncbi:heparinase II/III family protein [candidate division KSB1 bacterium]
MGKNSLKIFITFSSIFFIISISNAQVNLDSLSLYLGRLGLQTAEKNSENGTFFTSWKDITPLDLRILGKVRGKTGEKFTGGRFRITGSVTDTLNLEIKGYEQNFRHSGGPFIDIEPREIVANFLKGNIIPDIPSRQYYSSDFRSVWTALSHVLKKMEIPVDYIDYDSGTIRSPFFDISDMTLNLLVESLQPLRNGRLKVIALVRTIRTNRQQVILTALFEGERTSNSYLENIILNETEASLSRLSAGNYQNESKYYGFEEKVNNISDNELFNAIEGFNDIYGWVNNLFQRNNLPAVFDNDAYLEYVEKNALRRSEIREGENIYRNLFPGSMGFDIQFGKTVDFNFFPGISDNSLCAGLSFTVPLLRAYIITKNQKYIRKFSDLIKKWLEQKRNMLSGFTYDLDYMYSESAVTERIINLLDFYKYTATKYVLSYDIHKRILKELLSCGRWLYNEKIGQAEGTGINSLAGDRALVMLAASFPEFTESAKWLRRGLSSVNEHLNQIAENKNAEEFIRTPSHLFNAAEIFTNVLETVNSTDQALLGENFETGLESIFDRLVKIKTPLNTVPGFNLSSYPDLTNLLKKGKKLFNREEYENVTIGVDSLIQGKKLPGFLSVDFKKGSVLAMRNGWTNNALYMAVNYWKNNSRFVNSSLDFTVFAFGRPMALPAGKPPEKLSEEQKNWYASSSANNVLNIDELEPDLSGNNIKVEKIKLFKNIDYFSAINNGFAEKTGISNNRKIVFIKPEDPYNNYWVVRDEMDTGDGLYHKYTWNYHSYNKLLKHTTNMIFDETSPGMVIKYFPGTSDIRIRSGPGLDPISNKTAELSWLDLSLLSREDEPSFNIILIPFPENRIVPGTKYSGNTLEIQFENYIDYISFSPGKKTSDIPLNGEYTLTVMRIDGDISYISVIDGKEIIFENRKMFESVQVLSLELEFKGDKLYVSGENPTGAKVYAPAVKEVYYNNEIFVFSASGGYIELGIKEPEADSIR